MNVSVCICMCVCVYVCVCVLHEQLCLCSLMCGGYCLGTCPASTSFLCQTAQLPLPASSALCYVSKGGYGTAVVTLRHPTLIGPEDQRDQSKPTL